MENKVEEPKYEVTVHVNIGKAMHLGSNWIKNKTVHRARSLTSITGMALSW